MIGIVDYGMGNLNSILKALQRISEPAFIANSAEALDRATHIILPGVGHFRVGMDRLNALGFLDVLNKKILMDRIPVLGICLGAQLLTDYSEEGDTAGLGWISGNTIRFSVVPDAHLRIPHMGWNNIKTIKENDIFNQTSSEDQYYFVHSYFIKCRNSDHVLATTHYQTDIHVVIRKGNIVGMQFHPEKSYEAGLILLKNFAAMS